MAFTTTQGCVVPEVTAATLDTINPCRMIKTPPATLRRKPYDRPPKGDPNHRTRAQRRNTMRNSIRLHEEKEANEAANPFDYKVSLKTSIKFANPASIPLANTNTTDLKASDGAYESMSRKTVTDTTVLTVDKCIRRRYIEVEWNGW